MSSLESVQSFNSLTPSLTPSLSPKLFNGIPITLEKPLELSQVLLKVDFRLWGDEIKADKGEMVIDSDKRLLSLRKKLIESKEYEEIKGLTKKIGKKILKIGLPASKSFRPGFYRVPLASLADMDTLLIESHGYFLAAVQDFLYAFQDAKERASKPKEEGGLGILYNEADYPSLIELESRFSFSWQFLSFALPDSLPDSLAKREQENFLKNLQEGREECMQALRVGFAALIDRATERLQERPDGKRLKFQESLTTQLAEFLESFSPRNSIGNDTELAILVAKARSILNDCPDLKDLKDDSSARARIQARFASIQEELIQANMIPKKGRAIQLQDEAEAV